MFIAPLDSWAVDKVIVDHSAIVHGRQQKRSAAQARIGAITVKDMIATNPTKRARMNCKMFELRHPVMANFDIIGIPVEPDALAASDQ